MEHLKEKHLVIRVDASTQIGTGHLMRCLALAQAWKDTGGKVAFITACQSESLLQRLREEGFDIHLLARPYPDAGDWEYTKNILAAYPSAWVVLDGYHFDGVYQQWVKEAGHQLLVIDDMAHLKHYYADIVLNQNLRAEQLPYSCEPYTCLLLGTRYVLLRREFLTWIGWKREVPEVARRVLVTLGGGDPENYTLKVVQALQRVDVPALEATVVIGASNPHAETLQASIRQGSPPIRLVSKVKNMTELMAWADVAVASAGTTTWELLFLGTPILALISAYNQQYVAEQIQVHKVGKNLGEIDDISTETLVETITLFLRDFDSRAKACENAQQIVDGQGVQRVMAFMQKTESFRVRLRPATLDDCRLVWEWSNDPAARAASFSSKAIGWEEHVTWFKTKLCSPCCHHYIVLNERNLAIGQVRFDIEGNRAEISISIGSRFRGQGYGAEAIRLASERLFCETGVIRINAHIKQGNETSVRAFAKAGYVEIGVKVVKEKLALQMTLERYEGLSKSGSRQD